MGGWFLRGEVTEMPGGKSSSCVLYLFCAEGSRLSSRTCPALGGCTLTMPSGEESSGPKSCAGFFYKKNKKNKGN